MKLTAIEIDQFGVWEDFRQSLNPEGVTVFHGTNGTGKTTLLRFVRGVLYGFEGEDTVAAGQWRDNESRSGRLKVTHFRQNYEIGRTARGRDAGEVTLSPNLRGLPAERRLEELLQSVDSRMFHSVFALGLHELQQLATLEDDDVSQQIYALTLGHEAAWLSDFEPHLDQHRRALYDAEAGSGELYSLLKRRDRLQRELEEQLPSRKKYRDLAVRRSAIREQIEKLTEQIAARQSSIRGEQHYRRVHAPWNKVREIKRELGGWANWVDLPESVFEQLEGFEQKLSVAEANVSSAQRELADWERRLGGSGDSQLGLHADEIRNWLVQREQFRGWSLEMTQAEQSLAAAERELPVALTRLGRDWTVERLSRVDQSPAGQGRLLAAGRQYYAVRQRHDRQQERYRQVARTWRKRELALREQLHDRELLCERPDQSLEQLAERVARLEHVLGTQRQLQLADRDWQATLEQKAWIERQPEWPAWATITVGAFLVGGLVLAIAGLQAAIGSATVVGMIFVLMSLASITAGWAIRNWWQAQAEGQDRSWMIRKAEVEQQLQTAESNFLAACEGLSLGQTAAADLQTEVLAELAELDQLAREIERVREARSRLSGVRERIRVNQRQLAEQRKLWCQTLTSLGYDECTRLGDAVAHWQHVAEARLLAGKIVEARRQVQQLRDRWSGLIQRLEHAGRQIDPVYRDYSQPLTVLDAWQQELARWESQREERVRWQRDLDRAREELSRRRQELDDLTGRRSALLRQYKVQDREGLVQHRAQGQRRRELLDRLKLAEQELDRAASQDREIALVEDELNRFDVNGSVQRVQSLEREIARLEAELKQARAAAEELLGQLQGFAGSRRSSRLRWERAHLDEQLKVAANRWLAVEAADDVLSQLRSQYARSNQPEILAKASPFLSQLTCGRYRNIWTPMGRHQLCVDDVDGKSWPVQLLSGGTREQLFLALRLAMIERFSQKGVELPVLFDDVTVNFDHERSRAAVDTLMSFARAGHQVLVFTSHLHFAELFRAAGQEPVWLPGPSERASRLARLAS